MKAHSFLAPHPSYDAWASSLPPLNEKSSAARLHNFVLIDFKYCRHAYIPLHTAVRWLQINQIHMPLLAHTDTGICSAASHGCRTALREAASRLRDEATMRLQPTGKAHGAVERELQHISLTEGPGGTRRDAGKGTSMNIKDSLWFSAPPCPPGGPPASKWPYLLKGLKGPAKKWTETGRAFARPFRSALLGLSPFCREIAAQSGM